MENRLPTWLTEGLGDRPKGFQAEVAREAGLTTDKLSKILSGVRVLKHTEAEALRDALQRVDQRSRQEPESDQLADPEVNAEVVQIIGKKPWSGRPATLVFLLTSGNYSVFQLDPAHLEELQQALRDMTGA